MVVVDRLMRWLEGPINALLWIGIIAGFLMMVHVTADVASRTIFNDPIQGTTEIVSGWYMIAVAYLPWAFIARNDDHIAVDLFTRLAPARVRTALEIIAKMVTCAWVLLFAYHATISALQQTRAGEVWQAAGFFISVWPSRWLLPIAGFSMGLYLVLRVIADLGQAMRSRGQGA